MMYGLGFKLGSKLWEMALETAIVAAAGIAGTHIINRLLGGDEEHQEGHIQFGVAGMDPPQQPQPQPINITINVDSNNGNSTSGELNPIPVDMNVNLNIGDGQDDEEDYDDYEDEEE